MACAKSAAAVACAGAMLVAAAPLAAENWPQWRGPFLNGSTSETNLPATWTQTENIAWAARLPGRGAATPIIWGDRVFLSSLGAGDRVLVAMCLDRKTGEVLWQNDMGRAADFIYKRNTMTSCSPATDGQRVHFLFGSGDLAAMDLAGKVLWSRNLQKDHGQWSIYYGYSASPLLHGGRLYVPVLHRDPRNPEDDAPRQEHRVSYILCIDPATGKDLWKHIRPTDAVGECQESYATPMPCRAGARQELIIAGGDHVTAHDPATGKELWRWGNYNLGSEKWWRVVASPLVIDDLVVMATPQHGPLYVIRAGGSGELGLGRQAWVRRKEDLTPDCSTPLYYGGSLYFLHDDERAIVCADPRTGKEKWRGDLGTRGKIFRASPTGADGKVYCISQDGEAVVLAAGGEFKVLHRVEMGGKPCWSSIAVSGGNLFLRTAEKLYCIGPPAK